MMSSIYRGTMAVILIASLIGTLWAIVPAERAYAANLVANPGFESGLWADRNSTDFSIDGVVRHSGSSSLKVEGSTAGQHMISEPIPIHAFEGYRLKAWIRSDLAGSQSSLSIGLLPVTAANQPLPWYPGGQSTLVDAGGGRQGWTQYSATIRDLPAAAVAVKIYLRIGAGASGSAWFDDISFESANLAPVGGFEAGLWSVNNGFVQDVGESHGGSSSASAVGQTAGRSLQSGLVPIKEKERYTLTAWVKTDQVSSSDGAAVSVLQVDGSNQSLGWFGGSVKLLTAGGTNGWIKLEAELSDFAQGTENVRLYLRLDGGVTGTVWFDDVRLMQRYRDGFMWGVNAHGKSAGDYPASQLGNQMQKGADLGISHYRINVNPDIISGNYDWTYLDQVVDTAYNKGLKLFLVLYSSLNQSASVLEQRGEDIAARYQGKIAYYQIGNEIDLDCIRGAQYDGSLVSHYDPVLYAQARDQIVALGNGLRAGDPDAKHVINMTYKHTAFLEMLNADEVNWDVTGLNWYSNMGDIAPTLAKLQSYPQDEIHITEINIRHGTQTKTEQEQAAYIEQAANQVYYEAPSKVKGFYVYELLDEPSFTSGEGHYGLVYSSGGVIGAEKLAYGVYQDTISNKN